MDAMTTFLSEDNILIHKEYMRTLRLRHSIFEKSIPEIKDKSVLEIEKMRLEPSVKSDILHNLKEYCAHYLYFNSFGPTGSIPKIIKKCYSSVESFLYEVYLVASKNDGGFVYVFSDGNNTIKILHSDDIRKKLSLPRLAIDISEHAYFLDYRFEKDKYIRSAISNLNISLLDNYQNK